MPRKPMTCPRAYRDENGAPQRCDGPMEICIGNRTWTCRWCGCMVPVLGSPR